MADNLAYGVKIYNRNGDNLNSMFMKQEQEEHPDEFPFADTSAHLGQKSVDSARQEVENGYTLLSSNGHYIKNPGTVIHNGYHMFGLRDPKYSLNQVRHAIKGSDGKRHSGLMQLMQPNDNYQHTDKDWNDLIDYIDSVTTALNKKGIFRPNTGLYLAAMPLNAIITSNDVVSDNLELYRDGPMEMVVKEIIPQKLLFEGNKLLNLKNEYTDKIKKGALPENAVRELLGMQDVKIIPSDENMKYIYKDMCEFLNSYNRHNNICKGCKELGQ